MDIKKAGEYELTYTATDDCGNETSEVRTVLVAKEIEAGTNITLEKDGQTVTINSDTYSKEEIMQMIAEYATKAYVDDLLKDISGSVDNVSIEGGQSLTVAVDLNMPDGYELASYSQITVQAATDGGANQTNVGIRWFGRLGGGTKANIALRNYGSNTAKVKVGFIGLAKRK